MSCPAIPVGERRHRRTATSSKEAAAARGNKRSGRLFGWLRRRLERRRQGFALARLSDLALRDIGLNRIDAEAEADRLRWNP
jgi:uncharacterized protein YjiS (DUF1127 family)